MIKSIYIQALMNYFYSNGTNTVFEQPKQIMTFRSADIPIYAYCTTGLDSNRLKDVILEYSFMYIDVFRVPDQLT